MTKRSKLVVRKTAFWVSLGASIGVGTALALGPDDLDGPLPIFVFIAAMGVTVMLFLSILMGNVRSIAQLEQDPSALPARMLGRVESLDEAGVVLNNRNHLFTFTATVFPTADRPRQARFKQFITMGELPNFYTGRYIVVAYDENHSEQLLLDKTPPPEWGQRLKTAGAHYDDVVASPTTAAPEPIFRAAPVDRKKLPLNLAVSFACLLIGFFGSIACSPIGLRGFFDWTRGLPARVTGTTQPLYESPQLDNALARLHELLRDRQLTECNVYDEYITLEARSATNPKGRDSYTYRDGALKRDMTASGPDDDPDFSITEVSPEMIRRTAQSVHQQHPGEPLSYVGYRIDHSVSITTSTTTINGSVTMPIPTTTWDDRLMILVVTEGEYGGSTHRFDAKTGEELPSS